MRSSLPGAVCLVIGLTPATLLSSGDGKVERLGVVDRAIEYHGGDAYSRSETRLRMCAKSGCSNLRARVDGGIFDLEAAGRVSAGERRVRITNEAVVWWENGEQKPVPHDREPALRNWVMARIYFTFLPFRLNDPSVYKEDLGLEEWHGRRLHKIKVTFTPGSSTHARDEFLYWFDPESGRLEQFAYSYTTGSGGLRFREAFNHRRVGGISFFDQENYGIEGAGLSVDLVTQDYVARSMRRVSTIVLSEIEVEGL